MGADLKMLMRSWPFVSDIVLDPERLVDLKVLDEMVSQPVPSSFPSLPALPPSSSLPSLKRGHKFLLSILVSSG